MGVRALRARIECDHQTLLHLWRTHCVFCQRLPSILAKLLAMRRGKCGDSPEHRELYRRIAQFVLARDSKDAPYLLNSVSTKGWKPATALKMKATLGRSDGTPEEVSGDTWAAEAARLSADGVLAFDKKTERDGLPDSLFQPLVRDAVAYLSGHDKLVGVWKQEYHEWQEGRRQWEAAHPEYMRLRPRSEEGERNRGGRFAKRAERDRAYLDWLEDNPDLAAWRGGDAKIVPLDDAARRRVAGAKPWKQATVRAEEFWKRNRELHALHELHVYHEREFVRRRKTRRNKPREGFKQRPTFTMPDPVIHPRWTLFNAPQTSPQGYKDLILPSGARDRGALKLRLLTGPKADGKYPNGWVTVRFRPDPRLARLRAVSATRRITKGRNKGQEVQREAFVFDDNQLGKADRPAQVSGVKLIFRDIRLDPDKSKPIDARLKSATAYLVFAVNIKDLPRTERANAIKFQETGELTKKGKKRKTRTLPTGLVSVAVDLATRGVGFLTRAVSGIRKSEQTHDGVRVLQSRYIEVGDLEEDESGKSQWSPGPDLAHIAEHKREIRRLRRLRGKPVKGEKSHIELQDHITDMGEDRFKKAARKIVNEAFRGCKRAKGEYGWRADVVLYENLETLLPDAERERGINRALLRWNRARLVEHLKRMCDDAGIRHFPVSPKGTSQVCSKCGALGRRYSIVRDPNTRRPSIRFGWVERLFACPNPECRGRDPRTRDKPFTCNADHNASVNLHRRFVLGDKAVKEFLDLPPRDTPARADALREIEEALRPGLERLHNLGDSPVDSPS